MVSGIQDQVKRQANIKRAFERAIAERVQVVAVGDILTSTRWLAKSTGNANTWYTVELEMSGDGIAKSCTCQAGQKGLACKHAAAVERAWSAEYTRQLKLRIASYGFSLA